MRIPSTRAYLLISCLSCLLYANTLTNELVFDDQRLIEEQTAIRHPWDFVATFGGRYWGEIKKEDPLYRPLTIWSLALNYRVNRILSLPGEHPAGYRVANLLLHALASCALYRFLAQSGIAAGAGLAAALLFVTHPIHTEAVDAIANRSELLALGFGLTFLVLHGRRRWIGALFFGYIRISQRDEVGEGAVVPGMGGAVRVCGTSSESAQGCLCLRR